MKTAEIKTAEIGSLKAQSYNEIFLNPIRDRNEKYEDFESANGDATDLLDAIEVRQAYQTGIGSGRKNIVSFNSGSGYEMQDGGYSLEEIVYALIAKVKELETESGELKTELGELKTELQKLKDTLK